MVEKIVSTPDSGSTFGDTGVFSKDEVNILLWLISQLETSATSSSFTHAGNLATILNASATISRFLGHRLGGLQSYDWYIIFFSL
jgi:hypothetical protein